MFIRKSTIAYNRTVYDTVVLLSVVRINSCQVTEFQSFGTSDWGLLKSLILVIGILLELIATWQQGHCMKFLNDKCFKIADDKGLLWGNCLTVGTGMRSPCLKWRMAVVTFAGSFGRESLACCSRFSDELLTSGLSWWIWDGRVGRFMAGEKTLGKSLFS